MTTIKHVQSTLTVREWKRMHRLVKAEGTTVQDFVRTAIEKHCGASEEVRDEFERLADLNKLMTGRRVV